MEGVMKFGIYQDTLDFKNYRELHCETNVRRVKQYPEVTETCFTVTNRYDLGVILSYNVLIR